MTRDVADLLAATRFVGTSQHPAVADAVRSAADVVALVALVPELARSLAASSRPRGTVMPGAVVEGDVVVEQGGLVEPGAYVRGPTYVAGGATIRHGAYVRGGCVLLEGAVLGHGSEAKNALFLEGAKAAHFAYVGDSVLGQGCNLGAGVVLSNLPLAFGSHGRLKVVVGGVDRAIEARKFGAVVGDRSQLGARAVTSPATLLGRGCVVYPQTRVPGRLYADGSVIRQSDFGKDIVVETPSSEDQSGPG